MIFRAARYLAGMPLLVAAYLIADMGAYDVAYAIREAARRVAGVDNDG